jgi:hypothetical protein
MIAIWLLPPGPDPSWSTITRRRSAAVALGT